jgi:hypothetical protein
MRWRERHFIVRFFLALLLQACLAVPLAKAQTADPLQLLRRITELSKVGRYSDAIPLGQQLVREMERMLGNDHPLAGTALVTLADLHRLQGQLDEAEPMLRRALTIGRRPSGRGIQMSPRSWPVSPISPSIAHNMGKPSSS